MYYFILKQYSGIVLEVRSLPFVVLQISAGGGGKDEKEYMYSFAPSQPPDKSKTASPSYRVSGVWGGLAVAVVASFKILRFI